MHYQAPWVGIAGGGGGGDKTPPPPPPPPPLSSPDSLIVLGRMGLSEEVKVIPLINTGFHRIVSQNLSVSVRGS